MLAKQKASVILESILQAHHRRSSVVSQYSETITSFKQKKNKEEFVKSRKSLDDQFKRCTGDIGKLGRKLQGIDAEKTSKVGILNAFPLSLVCMLI